MLILKMLGSTICHGMRFELAMLLMHGKLRYQDLQIHCCDTHKSIHFLRDEDQPFHGVALLESLSVQGLVFLYHGDSLIP